MTRIFGDPSSFVEEALQGFTDIYSHYVQRVPGGVLRSTATPEGKVAVIAEGATNYTIVATSKAVTGTTKHQFTLAHEQTSTTGDDRTCVPAGKGGCGNDEASNKW